MARGSEDAGSDADAMRKGMLKVSSDPRTSQSWAGELGKDRTGQEKTAGTTVGTATVKVCEGHDAWSCLHIPVFETHGSR